MKIGSIAIMNSSIIRLPKATFNHKFVKKFILLLIPCIAITLLFHSIPNINLKEVSLLFLNFPKAVFLAISAIFTFNFFLVALRQFLIYRQFKCYLTYFDILRASLCGHLYGLFFIPFLSTILGQSLELKHTFIPPSITTFVTSYERFFTMGIGALLMLFSLLYLNPEFLNSLEHLYISIVHLTIPISLVFTLVIGFLYFSNKHFFQNILTIRNLLYVIASSFISATSWVLTPFAFALVLLTINPEIPIIKAVSASIIVSFIASLPITPNGWGIREFAAIKIFAILGFSISQSLFVSIGVCLTSIITLLVPGNILLVFARKFQTSRLQRNLALSTRYITFNNSFAHLEKKIIVLLAIAASIGIFFQIKLQIQETAINVNLADIFALAGLAISVLNYILFKQKPLFILPFTINFLCWSTGVFFLSFLIGWYKFGFIHWAFFSKFLGWFIIIGYVMLGSLFAHSQGRKGIKQLISLMSLTLVIIIVYQTLLLIIFQNGILPQKLIANDYFAYAGLVGYALNRNAFVFQLLVMIVLQQSMYLNKELKISWFQYSILGLLCFGVYLTFSRSGLITIATLFSILLLTKLLRFDHIKRLTISIFGCFIFFFLLQRFLHIIVNFNLSSDLSSTNSIFKSFYSEPSSNHERFYTITEGLKMWLNNPFFGEGLGSFMIKEKMLYGRTLIIHNSLIWILAESGIVGASVFILFGVRIFKHLYEKIWSFSEQKIYFNTSALLGLAIVFSTMSLVHEMLYQRIFWFAWGIFMIYKQANTDVKQN